MCSFEIALNPLVVPHFPNFSFSLPLPVFFSLSPCLCLSPSLCLSVSLSLTAPKSSGVSETLAGRKKKVWGERARQTKLWDSLQFLIKSQVLWKVGIGRSQSHAFFPRRQKKSRQIVFIFLFFYPPTCLFLSLTSNSCFSTVSCLAHI